MNKAGHNPSVQMNTMLSLPHGIEWFAPSGRKRPKVARGSAVLASISATTSRILCVADTVPSLFQEYSIFRLLDPVSDLFGTFLR